MEMRGLLQVVGSWSARQIEWGKVAEYRRELWNYKAKSKMKTKETMGKWWEDILENSLLEVMGYVRGKCKVVPVLLTDHHPMKAYWREWRYSSTHSLTSALGGGEWSVSRPCRLIRVERAHGTHWIGGWVGSGAVLDAVMKRRIPTPAGNRTLELRSSSP
jgi:hypothetical protein